MKFIFLLFGLAPMVALAQEDLLSELEESSPKKEYVYSTFKGSRLVNGHTVKTSGKGELEFIFQHRFGLISGGWYELFGLDQAFVRLGLDYGVTDRLSVSIGRNSVDKTWDGYAKYQLFQQATGKGVSPVSVTLLGGMAYKTSPPQKDNPSLEPIDRMAYVGQALIARKISHAISLQLMPTWVHKNAVDQSVEDNDLIALGAGGRWKVTRSMALTFEYYPRLNPPDNDQLVAEGLEKRYDALGFGIELETGGHVFQLCLTNTNNLTERSYITETTGSFFDGDIHMGFNITRGFQVRKQKK